MRVGRYLFLSLCAALISCATTAPVQSWDYRTLSSRPTPEDWKPGSVWTFVIADRSGKSQTLTFRLSDEVAQTCMPGDWRKLDQIAGAPRVFAGVAARAAYKADGSFLWVSLNSNWCDVNDDIRGELAGAAFKGERSMGGATGSSQVGTVRGWRVR